MSNAADTVFMDKPSAAAYLRRRPPVRPPARVRPRRLSLVIGFALGVVLRRPFSPLLLLLRGDVRTDRGLDRADVLLRGQDVALLARGLSMIVLEREALPRAAALAAAAVQRRLSLLRRREDALLPRSRARARGEPAAHGADQIRDHRLPAVRLRGLLRAVDALQQRAVPREAVKRGFDRPHRAVLVHPSRPRRLFRRAVVRDHDEHDRARVPSVRRAEVHGRIEVAHGQVAVPQMSLVVALVVAPRRRSSSSSRVISASGLADEDDDAVLVHRGEDAPHDRVRGFPLRVPHERRDDLRLSPRGDGRPDVGGVEAVPSRSRQVREERERRRRVPRPRGRGRLLRGGGRIVPALAVDAHDGRAARSAVL
eukprot:31270-Pelagococcus_subviridis.AAC.26